MRYDCDVVVVTVDDRHFRWESVVVASDIKHAVEQVSLHAASLFPSCRIEELGLCEIWPGHPLSSVDTPSDGVHAIADLSEVMRSSAESPIKKWWQRMTKRFS